MSTETVTTTPHADLAEEVERLKTALEAAQAEQERAR